MTGTSGRDRQESATARGWWKRGLVRRTQVALDVCAVASAFVVAYLLRFDFVLPKWAISGLLSQLPYVVVVQVLSLWGCGVYKLVWRYVGLGDVRRFAAAAALGAVPLLIGRVAFSGALAGFRVPVSVTLVTTVLVLCAVLGLRVLRRVLFERYEKATEAGGKSSRLRKPVLLVGAGRAGVLAVREILGRGDIGIEVKGFVDDDREKVGSEIAGVTVLGMSDDIPRLVRELEIDHVVITIAKGSRADILRIVEICDRVPVKARIIPGLYDILEGRVALNPIRDIEIEDLLGRDPVRLDAAGLRGFLCGRVVLVTGAGGSIGSELVRQVARYEPSRLLLVERAEPFLFQIEQEMRRAHAELDVVPLIADVGDEERMTQIFSRHRPAVVFHAAAHKHVPMMEWNPGEAVKNNVIGTLRLGRVAAGHGCDAFVLISTDKAVNPTSIMGASKRVAEQVAQWLGERHPTKFVAVRFGNVLGSTGSVVPTFKEQIRKGGPVTVTDPEMRRYFMTIPEAAQLVLQAGALGKGGEIFILDMGEPVRIVDLARDMIRLSGLRPDEDVEIRYTGLRPGEKLFEELGTTEDRVEKTRHPKIFIGRIPKTDPGIIDRGLARLEALALDGDEKALREALADLVPEGTFCRRNGEGKPPEAAAAPVPEGVAR